MCVGVGVGVGGREGLDSYTARQRREKGVLQHQLQAFLLPLFQPPSSGQVKMENINIHFIAVHNYYHRKSMVLGGSNLEESLPYEMRHSVGSCNILQVRI